MYRVSQKSESGLRTDRRSLIRISRSLPSKASFQILNVCFMRNVIRYKYRLDLLFLFINNLKNTMNFEHVIYLPFSTKSIQITTDLPP